MAGRQDAARTSEPLGLEEKLWRLADQLRGSMDAAEYKHVVLGLIFLKYISDTFEKRRSRLERELSDPGSPEHIPDQQFRDLLLESRDEYAAEGVFWVPADARWKQLADHAADSDIGRRVDAAMELVEKENPTLRTVLPKDYGRPSLEARRLGDLINLIGSIHLAADHHGDNDILGRVYE
jgi:type I restriction enzyme M protein